MSPALVRAGASAAGTVMVLAALAMPSLRPDGGARATDVVARFQCNRCHVAEGRLEPPPLDQQCVGCHVAVLAGELDDRYDAEALARWKGNIRHLRMTPSLTGLGARFRRDWLVAFLQEPHDLRPGLEDTMPRMPITREDAEAIATWFGVEDQAPKLARRGDAARGRRVLERKGCGACHVMTGAPPLPAAAPPSGLAGPDLAAAIALAPDLAFARERMTAAALDRWLRDPRDVKPDSLMPRIVLSGSERADLIACLLETPLAPTPRAQVPRRLPLLARDVRHEEVRARVLARTCGHCHEDPRNDARDGGPGNTGGFGFPPRGVDFTSRETILRGRIADERGHRESLVEPGPDGTPRLVAVLMARWSETAGQPVPGLRGMPLGLPPLPLEDIQLVETWVARGCPE